MGSAKSGQQLLYWNDRGLAEEKCKQYTEPNPHRVVEIDLEELLSILQRGRDSGMQNVVMDLKIDGSARVVPISEAIDHFAMMSTMRNVIRRSSADQFVRQLDHIRLLGGQTSREDEYIPIDCPNCGELISVHELTYRPWRDGKGQGMLCPHCYSTFRDAPFSQVTCRTCGKQSGYMPVSICDQYAPGTWLCEDCCFQEAKHELS
jgi:hypothetical protein